MQVYADVTGCTMQISSSAQTCALGTAIAAAVAAGKDVGGYDGFAEAQEAMTSVKPEQYEPDPETKEVYDELYGLYRTLHDGFGGVAAQVDVSQIMKKLIALKEAQSK
jgi:L-ribulokinase